MTLSTLFPIVTGWTMKCFFFLLAHQFKILKISLNFHGKNMPTTYPKVANFFNEINHKFCKHNAKHHVLAQVGRGHVRREMGKNERTEGQKSLHTTGGTTGYLCLAKLLTLNELCISAGKFVLRVVKIISSDV
jgi:hypothetical protein